MVFQFLPCVCRQVGNREIVVEVTDPKQTAYIYACQGSTIQVQISQSCKTTISLLSLAVYRSLCEPAAGLCAMTAAAFLLLNAVCRKTTSFSVTLDTLKYIQTIRVCWRCRLRGS